MAVCPQCQSDGLVTNGSALGKPKTLNLSPFVGDQSDRNT